MAKRVVGSTTAGDVEQSITEVEVFCRFAHSVISSDAPIYYKRVDRETKELERLLEEIPRRYRKLMRHAQRLGWAAK